MRARQMGSVVSVFDIDTGIAVIGKPLKKKTKQREMRGLVGFASLATTCSQQS